METVLESPDRILWGLASPLFLSSLKKKVPVTKLQAMWTLSLELKSGHEPFTPSSSYCCGNWDACVMSSFHLALNIPASWPSRPAQSSPALSLGFFLLFTVYPVRKEACWLWSQSMNDSRHLLWLRPSFPLSSLCLCACVHAWPEVDIRCFPQWLFTLSFWGKASLSKPRIHQYG